MSIDNNIVLRIKKLLELANSSNKNEAKIASTKAQELLVKYNLDMQQIDNIETSYNEHDLMQYKRVPAEVKKITRILSCHFFVVSLYNVKRNIATTITIFGTSSNIKIATYVYAFLLMTYRNLWKAYKKKNKRANKNSFMRGVSLGLRSKLRATRQKVENEYGLILKEDKVLSDWSSQYDKLKDKLSVNIKSKAFIEGYKQGQNIEIRKPINTDRKSSGGFLSRF